MDLKEIGINTRNWVDSVQDGDYWRALVNTALNLRVPYVIQVPKPTVKRPLGSPRLMWDDNFLMDLKEMGMNTRNWVDSVQDMDYWRVLVYEALSLQVP